MVQKIHLQEQRIEIYEQKLRESERTYERIQLDNRKIKGGERTCLTRLTIKCCCCCCRFFLLMLNFVLSFLKKKKIISNCYFLLLLFNDCFLFTFGSNKNWPRI